MVYGRVQLYSRQKSLWLAPMYQNYSGYRPSMASSMIYVFGHDSQPLKMISRVRISARPGAY